MKELSIILKLSEEFEAKLTSSSYYHSEQCRKDGQYLQELQKQYLENNPLDYLMKGVNLFQMQWHYVDEATPEDKAIYTLTGNAKTLEDKGLYEEAIELYHRANTLFFKEHGAELEEILEQTGAEELGEQVTEKRLRITKNKLIRREIKKMEKEAKELEQTNPSEAIILYEKLNELKPRLKKYNKRIEICKRKTTK